MTIQRRRLLGCALSLLLLGLPTRSVDAGQEPLAVVVSTKSSLNDLSLYKLKRLYLGDNINGPDGKRMVPLNRNGKTGERVGFDRHVLGMTPDESARYWIDRRIRGRSGAPKAVEPATVLQKVVSRLPGTISYVRLSEVSKDVKVLKIDGKKPGDSGYPIVLAQAPSS